MYYALTTMCHEYYSEYGARIPDCPENSSYIADTFLCKCDEDYYPSLNVCVDGLFRCVDLQGIGATYDSVTNTCGCSKDYEFRNGSCVLHSEICVESVGIHSRYNSITQACVCEERYVLQDGKCTSVLEVACPLHADFSKFGACECGQGYSFNASKTECILDPIVTAEPIMTPVPVVESVPVVVAPVVTTPIVSAYAAAVAGIKISAPDPALITRMKGRILLQTESHGEAWYVHPTTGKRHYMKDGSVAYQMMRNFGLGIKNADLAKIPTSNDTFQLPSSMKALKGKILLQVDERGEAWYVHPDTGKRYYMKDGNAAYQLMRLYSLGISNDNLGKIPSGE